MAQQQQLPCDGDGICMLCKSKPNEAETLTCNTCVTPWHSHCLSPSSRPQTLVLIDEWDCPDCSPIIGDVGGGSVVVSVPVGGGSGDLIAAIRAIEADESLSVKEKAKKRQELVSGVVDVTEDRGKKEEKVMSEGDDYLEVLRKQYHCSFCMQLPEKPITTSCQHTFCLKCFQKWVKQGNRACPKCRKPIPQKYASHPTINLKMVQNIRDAKMGRSVSTGGPSEMSPFIPHEIRPDKWYITERAKKTGKANACSGKIFVTVPPDHFGPIPAENDPDRNKGVRVGESWEDRMDCRQWGAHLPHVAGIAGQSEHGAQSVALSGGYEDDEDHGEWFLYTGSGGRDLSGNKRTNKEQSSDQKFDKMNEALRVSCKKGYPVRVVRSHKEKRSSYAPETGVRYDGVYRIEKCWRKSGIQGFKVCRYLFVRCDNEPAPWTSDEHGDRPRPLPPIDELKQATDITERKEHPSWDYDEEDCSWKWKKPPPLSRKSVTAGNPEDRKRARKTLKTQNMSVREKLVKGFSCPICRNVMTFPLTTPCAHNFCKSCLEDVFPGQPVDLKCNYVGGRELRIRKVIMKCPCCPNDISDFLKDPQVNTELMGVIESLQSKTEETVENDEQLNDKETAAKTPEDEETEFNTVNSQMFVDKEKDVPNSSAKGNSKRPYNRRKPDVEGTSSELEGRQTLKTTTDNPEDVGSKSEISNEKPQLSVHEKRNSTAKLKQVYKRKKLLVNDTSLVHEAGKKGTSAEVASIFDVANKEEKKPNVNKDAQDVPEETNKLNGRSSKDFASNLEDVVDKFEVTEEGIHSPSSPLHVEMDSDDME
ncbi:hypothetical protein GIB67_004135 [Kingdonia uniflora]|uniref:RING-type E3 ubiquitin transferase n=1 Tax=Kingdonia uniflora TaxID=39325 RepID=A0A7J7NRL6_9MAGN|nr:hypothetical protein GIB67_004135 [Kingdonia uniflora]